MRLDPRVNNVISERNDKRHNALRAKMASGVSPTAPTFIVSMLTYGLKVLWQRKSGIGTVYR
jgi:hypothetical protein